MQKICISLLLIAVVTMTVGCAHDGYVSITKNTGESGATQSTAAPDTAASQPPVTSGTATAPDTSGGTPDTSAATTPAPVTTAPQRVEVPVVSTANEILFTRSALALYGSQTDTKAAMTLPEGVSVMRIGTAGYFSVLSYRGSTYFAETKLLDKSFPASATAKMNELGGIYYPGTGKLIAVDAGHQDHGMSAKEPLGPGSSELKAKLSSGTQGVATRIPEYELNLAVALRLRDELVKRGYAVVMIRETNDVNLSNADRAKISNAYKSDAFIRIHANGSDSQSANGAYPLYMTKNNPYNGGLYDESKKLAAALADGFCEKTGIRRLSDWATDTMTGINWAQTPVTIFEMGFMSNPDEDRLMATDEFRQAAAEGFADGLDRYFS